MVTIRVIKSGISRLWFYWWLAEELSSNYVDNDADDPQGNINEPNPRAKCLACIMSGIASVAIALSDL
ncbi:MAG: hypothetical protein ACETVW_01025 [Dehalococcoidia bacterium]